MKISLNGIALVKSFENCQLTAYKDTGGVWTIGWGHTGSDVAMGLTWTQDEADWALLQDLTAPTACVNRVVKVPLTQSEFDALVDFTYNCGCAAFEMSDALRMLNSGDYTGASHALENWDHVHGQVIAGLLRRRMAEASMFNGDGYA